MGQSIKTTILNQTLILLPDRAMYWEDEKMLIVADLHIGKGRIFRKNGIPVPAGITAGDLKRLSLLIEHLQPENILILGDLLHGRMDQDDAFDSLIEKWRQKHADVQLILVTGNHDILAGVSRYQFRFDQITDTLVREPFVFTHKPTGDKTRFELAGHFHPAVTIQGKGRLKETLPCFYFSIHSALLPAFGSFTGNLVIRPTLQEQVYVIVDDSVLMLRNGSQ